MKHCPNLECPFIEQTSFISEFRDEVMTCPDCETVLVDGPAPPVPESIEPRTWQPNDVVWNVASYSDEDEALADLDTLAEEGIEAGVKSEELPDEDGNLAQLYHLQVMPIDRFVTQALLGLDGDESQVGEEYWADLQESGHFGLDEATDDERMWDDLNDEGGEDDEEIENDISLGVVIIIIIIIITLIWSMTNMYRLF